MVLSMTDISNYMLAAIQQAVAHNPNVTAAELAEEFQTLSCDREAIADAILTASIQMADQEGGELTAVDILQSTDQIIAVARAQREKK